MKIFYRWLRDKLQRVDELESVEYSSALGRDESLSDTEDTYRFNMHRAVGGWVLQCSNYDQPKDEITRKTYIITDEQDLGESISKILTLEILRK